MQKLNYLKYASKLKIEAAEILKKTKIMEILSCFGNVLLTGSYSYDLMTWRDIDLCLAVEKPTPKLMLKIGTKLLNNKNVATMYYRNEYVLGTPGNPKAIFWCIELKDKKRKRWKIDILVSEKKTVEKVIKPGILLRKKLTPELRGKILALKGILSQKKGYRSTFRSTDIYKAVIDDNVSSISEWTKWLSEKRF